MKNHIGLFLVFLHIAFCIADNVSGDEPETRGRQKETQMSKEVDRGRPMPKCSNPRGNVGDSLLNGCSKRTCIQIKRSAGWIEEFAYENCCWQNQLAYKIGATFYSTLDQETGINTTMRCAQTSSGSPHIVVDVSPIKYENQEIVHQLSDIRDELQNKIDKVVEIGSELKDVKDLLESTLHSIHPCAVTNPCLDDDPCGPHSICNCTGGVAICSCKSGHQGSPPTCEQKPICGSTWTQFVTYCYKYFGGKLNWYDAQSRCEQEGGHLASIHSEKEHKFLATLSPQDSKVWIGANDLDKEGTFVWTDGTLWNYQNWGAEQPDNHNGMGGEHCGAMGWRGGEMSWNDLPCDADQRVFICKKK